MQIDRRPLFDRLAVFPRLGLADLPTPLEPMKRLTAHLGGPRLWVKREDATGLGFGGNKLRKLDYVLHEAVSSGADTIVSGGVVQSNSQRQVAAVAAKLGLACHLAVYHGRLAQRRGCRLLAHRRRAGAFRLPERTRHLNWRSQSHQGWGSFLPEALEMLQWRLGRERDRAWLPPPAHMRRNWGAWANVHFDTHSGVKSDIAQGPKSAMN